MSEDYLYLAFFAAFFAFIGVGVYHEESSRNDCITKMVAAKYSADEIMRVCK